MDLQSYTSAIAGVLLAAATLVTSIRMLLVEMRRWKGANKSQSPKPKKDGIRQ